MQVNGQKCLNGAFNTLDLNFNMELMMSRKIKTLGLSQPLQISFNKVRTLFLFTIIIGLCSILSQFNCNTDGFVTELDFTKEEKKTEEANYFDKHGYFDQLTVNDYMPG